MVRFQPSSRQLCFALLFIGFLTVSGVISAQSSGGDFVMTKSTIDNGGGVSSGGEFSLTGTIGQPDANSQISSGSDFVLAGGFWAKIFDSMFKDGFESD